MTKNMIKYLSMMVVFIVFIFLIQSWCYAETVKIVAEDDWFPYSGINNNEIKGIAVDVVREAFKAEGIDVEFDVMNYDRGMSLVKDGEAIGCFDAPRTKEIEEIYFWHEEPLFIAKSYFYAASDFTGSLNSVKDIGNRRLGLTQGYGYGNTIDMNDEIDKVYSKSDEVILKKLIAKRVDLIILFDRVADYLISKLGVQDQVKQAGLSENTDIYIAFSKIHPDGKKYCDIFSKGFRRIKENGIYQKIWDDWDNRLRGSDL